MVRTVIADSGLAEHHWETLAESAVYVHNRLPTARFPRSCPLTELTGTVPDISNLVPLGYPTTVKVYGEEGKKRSSLSPKGEECVVLGYEGNAYKVLTKSGRTLIRKDVIVNENWAIEQRHQHRHVQEVLLLDAEERATLEDLHVPVLQSSAAKIVKAVPPPAEPPPLRRSSRVSEKPRRFAFATSI
jgi:hypothetical protein